VIHVYRFTAFLAEGGFSPTWEAAGVPALIGLGLIVAGVLVINLFSGRTALSERLTAEPRADAVRLAS
jgi:hypothetical protein